MRFRGSMPAVVLAAGLALAGAVLAAPRTQTETKLQLVVSKWDSTFAAGGSIPSARKYLLRILGRPGEYVTLSAGGLARAWVVSFCTPTVCAPFHLSLQLPQSGEFDIELQVIPPDSARRLKAQVTLGALAANSRVTLLASTLPSDAPTFCTCRRTSSSLSRSSAWWYRRSSSAREHSPSTSGHHGAESSGWLRSREPLDLIAATKTITNARNACAANTRPTKPNSLCP